MHSLSVHIIAQPFSKENHFFPAQFFHILNVDNVDNVDRRKAPMIIANHRKPAEIKKFVRKERTMQEKNAELCQVYNLQKNPQGRGCENVYKPVDNVDNYRRTR